MGYRHFPGTDRCRPDRGMLRCSTSIPIRHKSCSGWAILFQTCRWDSRSPLRRDVDLAGKNVINALFDHRMVEDAKAAVMGISLSVGFQLDADVWVIGHGDCVWPQIPREEPVLLILVPDPGLEPGSSRHGS